MFCEVWWSFFLGVNVNFWVLVGRKFIWICFLFFILFIVIIGGIEFIFEFDDGRGVWFEFKGKICIVFWILSLYEIVFWGLGYFGRVL